jgi:hypothetical protein
VSITFGELKTTLASRLSDPDGDVFTDAILAELVNEALAEVGRYAPAMFTEDITLVEDTLRYIIRTDVFNGEATPEIELTRVELWDGDQTPPVIVYSILPAHAETSTRSDLGWTNWGGTLYLPNFAHTIFDGHEDTYFLRIYGYSPYVPLAEDSGGQQQRVAIARVLVQQPQAILADEPIASLDPERSREIMDLLRDLSLTTGRTLVTSLHDIDVARSHCERIIGLRQGQVLFDAPTEKVTPELIGALYKITV